MHIHMYKHKYNIMSICMDTYMDIYICIDILCIHVHIWIWLSLAMVVHFLLNKSMELSKVPNISSDASSN